MYFDLKKEEDVKRLLTRVQFLIDKKKEDQFIGNVQVIRSSSEIDTKQMTQAIDKFRNWSSKEAGIYLPDANEDQFLEHIRQESERQRQWL